MLLGSIQTTMGSMLQGYWGWSQKTGWWFGTFFIFPYIGNNHPNWLIFFRGVQTTNQKRFCLPACLFLSTVGLDANAARRLTSTHWNPEMTSETEATQKKLAFNTEYLRLWNLHLGSSRNLARKVETCWEVPKMRNDWLHVFYWTGLVYISKLHFR